MENQEFENIKHAITTVADDEIARMVGDDGTMTSDERDDIKTRILLDPTGSERLDAYLATHPASLLEVPDELAKKLDSIAKKPLALLGQIQDDDIPLDQRIVTLQQYFDDPAKMSLVLDVLVLVGDEEEQVGPEIWRALTRLAYTGSSYSRAVGPVVNAAAAGALAAAAGLRLSVGEPERNEQTYLEIAGAEFHVQLLNGDLANLQLHLSNPIGNIPFETGSQRANLQAYLLGFSRNNQPQLTHAEELDTRYGIGPESEINVILKSLDSASWYRLVLTWQR